MSIERNFRACERRRIVTTDSEGIGMTMRRAGSFCQKIFIMTLESRHTEQKTIGFYDFSSHGGCCGKFEDDLLLCVSGFDGSFLGGWWRYQSRRGVWE
jgi:hypothetical protein